MLALLGVGTVGASAQQVAVDGATASAALAELARRVEAGDAGAVAAFWRSLEGEGGPLVEPDLETPGHSIVTFIARGGPQVERVRLHSNLNVLLAERAFVPPDSLGWMQRLGGTDVWHLAFRLRNDVRLPYTLEIHGRSAEPERVTDPLNGDVWEPAVEGLRASVLELPGAPAQPWRNPSGEEGEGDWDELSAEDGSGRSVYVYKPVAWDSARAWPYPVLVGLGAFGHGIGMRVDRMVDALIGAGRLPPMVVALVDLTSDDESTRYRSTGAFILGELLPHLRDRYRVSADPADVVVSGMSRRGMVAALLALENPESFGNVVSLSGAFYWRPDGDHDFEWLTRRFAAAPAHPVRFYLAAGELETFLTPTNRGHYPAASTRHLYDVLLARGYDVEHVEYNGVHSELNWQDWLAAGLIHLLGRRR